MSIILSPEEFMPQNPFSPFQNIKNSVNADKVNVVLSAPCHPALSSISEGRSVEIDEAEGIEVVLDGVGIEAKNRGS